MTDSQIKVLVVDDSPVARELLVHILDSDPGVKVVATAASGQAALDALERLRPDIVTMDVHMPGLDGFETTRRIMETHPLPVIIVSGVVDPKESAVAFQTIEAGALAILERPVGPGHSDYQEAAARLVNTVKSMSEVRVVRRWSRRPATVAPSPPAQEVQEAPPGRIRAVAIGVSTGGPPVLRTILSGLPKDFPVPVLIVQHISAGFLDGLAEWLTSSTGFPVHIAAKGEHIAPGRAYIAPDDYHMGVDANELITLSSEPPDHGLRPSVARLFRSVASVYGKSAIGVLLTGMGRDGADELKLLRDAGAVTIAQDKDSSVVHGMPGEAIRIGGAKHVLPADQIAAALVSLVA